MKPPYQITTKILELISSISEKIGEINAAYLYKPPTELRKKNRIKTIQSSLEIEGNSLSLDQVTAILLSNYFFKALNFSLLSSYYFWGHMYPY